MKVLNERGAIYLLMIRLSEERWIQIGALGYLFFPRGFYGYVGSAQRGLTSRVNRHLRDQKPLHWHIDYLLQCAEIEIILCGPSPSDKECALAHQLSLTFKMVHGFGSTDCRCVSHLFFSPYRRPLVRVGCETFRRVGVAPGLYWKKRFIGGFDPDVLSGRSVKGAVHRDRRIEKYGKLVT